MRNQRRFKKSKSRFFSIIEKHIKSNAKEYIIAVLVLIIGIIVGVTMVNTSSEQNKEEMSGYINEFVESVKKKEYTIDGQKLFMKSAISNLKLAAILWVAGLTVIGIPVIYVSVGYKGVRIGYSMASIIATLGKTKGIVFSLSTMFFQNLIGIPCILAIMVSSVKMYKLMVKNRSRESLKTEVVRHTIFSLIMTSGMLVSAFFEYVFTISFFCDIIINFV